METRSYRNLTSEEKDKVIEKLLDKLDMEIYNPYEYGPLGVEIRKIEVENDD